MTKKHVILSFLIVTLVFSCKKEKEENHPINNKLETTEKKNFELDTSSIFGVFKLTKSDYAICINVQYGEKDFFSKKYTAILEKDSMPWITNRREKMLNYSYYDTISSIDLYYSKRLENEIKTSLKSYYYVYGINGCQKCSVKKVIFNSNECGSDFIAVILDVNNTKTGNPLIASEKELQFEPKSDYTKINQKIKKSAEKESTEFNYSNNKYNPIVFGNVENYYFTYHDDFKWFERNNNSHCQFPERAIFSIDKSGKIKLIWASEMDLLGLPCL